MVLCSLPPPLVVPTQSLEGQSHSHSGEGGAVAGPLPAPLLLGADRCHPPGQQHSHALTPALLQHVGAALQHLLGAVKPSTQERGQCWLEGATAPRSVIKPAAHHPH